MIAVTLPFFSYLFRGFSGSKSKADCIAISKVWTTGMLVAGEGPPHKRAGAPTSRLKQTIHSLCSPLNVPQQQNNSLGLPLSSMNKQRSLYNPLNIELCSTTTYLVWSYIPALGFLGLHTGLWFLGLHTGLGFLGLHTWSKVPGVTYWSRVPGVTNLV